VRAALVDPTQRQLVLADVPDPVPGAGQLLVRVAAAGVNRADLAVIAGTYHGTRATAPFVAGSELAGAGRGIRVLLDDQVPVDDRDRSHDIER